MIRWMTLSFLTALFASSALFTGNGVYSPSLAVILIAAPPAPSPNRHGHEDDEVASAAHIHDEADHDHDGDHDQVAKPEPPTHDHTHDHGDVHGVDRLIRWLGKFHPVVVHMPLGLLIAAAVAELLVIFAGGGQWLTGAGRYCVLFGALCAAVTAPLGWANAAFAGYSDDMAWVLTAHRWLGTTAAAWAVVIAALGEASHRAEGTAWRRPYRLALFAGAVLVGVTGHFGGTLVFGLDYYRW